MGTRSSRKTEADNLFTARAVSFENRKSKRAAILIARRIRAAKLRHKQLNHNLKSETLNKTNIVA